MKNRKGNNRPPLWLRSKLEQAGSVLSAQDQPQPAITGTAQNITAPIGNGCNVLNRAVSLSENAEYLVKPSIVAQFTAGLDQCFLRSRSRKSVREALMAVNWFEQYLSAAEETQQSRQSADPYHHGHRVI